MARKRSKEYLRRKYLRKMYGITPASYDKLFLEQNKSCKICETTTPGHNWHLDHDHSMGDIRGILCHTCNVGLGMFKDDTGLLIKAAQYLNNCAKA